MNERTVRAGDVLPGMVVALSQHAEAQLVMGVRPATEVDLLTLPVERRRGGDELPVVVHPAVLRALGQVRIVATERDLLTRGDADRYVVVSLADDGETVIERTFELHVR